MTSWTSKGNAVGNKVHFLSSFCATSSPFHRRRPRRWGSVNGHVVDAPSHNYSIGTIWKGDPFPFALSSLCRELATIDLLRGWQTPPVTTTKAWRQRASSSLTEAAERRSSRCHSLRVSATHQHGLLLLSSSSSSTKPTSEGRKRNSAELHLI